MKLVLFAVALALSASPALADWKTKAVELAKAEPAVADAMFPPNGPSFWASVKDDGSNRDGFASYLCLLLNEAGKPEDSFVVIRVWDAKAMQQEELKELGQAECG